MAALAAAAFAVAGVIGAGGAVAAQHYKVVATDPGNDARIVVPLADRLILRLTACESCGYRWKIMHRPDPAVIAFDQRLEPVDQCTGSCVGGNVLERWRFDSNAAGHTTVKLGYFGPNKTTPSKTLRLRLAVTT